MFEAHKKTAGMRLEIWENCTKAVMINPAAFPKASFEQFKLAGWKIVKVFEAHSVAEAHQELQEWKRTLRTYKDITVCDSVRFT